MVKLFSPRQVQKACLYVKQADDLLPAIEEKLRAAASESHAAKAGYQLHAAPSHKGEIWVYAELHNGSLAPAVPELLGKARELADILGEKVAAVLIGSGVRGRRKPAIAFGADTVDLADDPKLAAYNSVSFSAVVGHFVQKHKPQIMLFGATPLGRELAPRVAYATASGLTADCTQLDIGDHAGETAILLQTRPALGGNIMATIVSKHSLAQMATVRPGVFASPEPNDSRKGAVVEYDGAIPPGTVEVVSVAPAPERKNLASAQAIVSGGAGLRRAENFRKFLGPLATALARRWAGPPSSAPPAARSSGPWPSATSRSARPGRPSSRTSTLRWRSRARSSISRACRSPKSSSRSTRTPRPRSSALPISAWSARPRKSCPPCWKHLPKPKELQPSDAD